MSVSNRWWLGVDEKKNYWRRRTTRRRRISEIAVRNREPAEVTLREQFVLRARDGARRLNRCMRVTKVDVSHFTATEFADGSTQCPTVAETAPTYALKLDGDIVDVEDFTGATDGAHAIFLRNGGTPYTTDAVITVDLKGSGRKRTLRILSLLGFVRQK